VVQLIRWEIPRLCQSGSSSLTNPGVCPIAQVRQLRTWRALRNLEYRMPNRRSLRLSIFKIRYSTFCGSRTAKTWCSDSIGCDQAPLRGQQPESLRLCRRIITRYGEGSRAARETERGVRSIVRPDSKGAVGYPDARSTWKPLFPFDRRSSWRLA
jgi:hypothetical protein